MTWFHTNIPTLYSMGIPWSTVWWFFMQHNFVPVGFNGIWLKLNWLLSFKWKIIMVWFLMCVSDSGLCSPNLKGGPKDKKSLSVFDKPEMKLMFRVRIACSAVFFVVNGSGISSTILSPSTYFPRVPLKNHYPNSVMLVLVYFEKRQYGFFSFPENFLLRLWIDWFPQDGIITILM